MGQIKTFHDSTHAKNRRCERDISIESMKAVVNYPEGKRQQYRGLNGGFVCKFSKTVDSKTLVVIAEVKKSECWLISAFFQ